MRRSRSRSRSRSRTSGRDESHRPLSNQEQRSSLDQRHQLGSRDRTEEKLDKIKARRAQEQGDACLQEQLHSEQAKTRTIKEREVTASEFIRYADDPALNQRQKGETRWDDPARHFIPGMRAERASFRAPPNRFNIPPGPHWDGIDRSNGFERRLFQKMAGKEAVQELSYQHDYQDL